MTAELFTLWLLSGLVSLSAGWEMFTDMRDAPRHTYNPNMVHSMYSFGNCNRHGIVLYTHVHLEAIDILGKLIVRGWLDIKRIPTCIILKAVSFERELLQNTLQNFQFCVPRISYCHSHKRFKYYFFEWYVPYFFQGGMSWELFFFGLPSQSW